MVSFAMLKHNQQPNIRYVYIESICVAIKWTLNWKTYNSAITHTHSVLRYHHKVMKERKIILESTVGCTLILYRINVLIFGSLPLLFRFIWLNTFYSITLAFSYAQHGMLRICFYSWKRTRANHTIIISGRTSQIT